MEALIASVGQLAEAHGMSAYLVGGPVRDLMLGRKGIDLDIVIEGNGMKVAEAFAKAHHGKVITYPAFKTATVTLADGQTVDFATARTEKYPKPGVFPVVTPSTIKNDLFRRDFTINAMAIGVNPSMKGKLVDFFGGKKDLKAKRIRILHDKSFVDDPTRIFRAVRFAERLGFAIERKTLVLLKGAIKQGALTTVKGNRINKEMVKINTEKNKARMISQLKVLGALQEGN
jgi:tRNA nucleotidyltransferase (CCA-adding enzyme)